jgi:hypothetical protein
MKAYAIAAETIKAQAMLIHTARRCLRRSFRSADHSSCAEGT